MIGALLALPPLAAAESAWLRFIDGPPGEAKDKDHKGWSVISGFGIATTLASGQSGTFRISRTMDKSSGPLFLAMAKRRVFPEVEIDIAPSDASRVHTLLRLQGAVVLLQQLEASVHEDSAREELEIGFQSITYTYYPLPLPGNPDDGNYATFDYTLRTGSEGTVTGEEPPPPVPPPTSVTLTKSVDDPDGSLRLSWASVPEQTYLIEWSPDLKKPFEPIRTVVATGEIIMEELPMESSTGFYRIRIP